MSELPQVGDKVRVTYEGIVTDTRWPPNGGEMRVGDIWHEDFELSAAQIEILERADDPSKDPAGTVRQLDGGQTVYVKIRTNRWSTVLNSAQASLELHNDEMLHSHVIGTVPSSEAAAVAA